MVVLDCLGFLLKKNDSVKKTTNDDEHAILGYNLGYETKQLSMIDVKSTMVRKVSGLEAERGVLFRMVNNCNGLIMLISFSHSVIFNPKSNKIVKRITLPVWLFHVGFFHGGFPVGLFYHPLAKEYRTLNAITVGDNRYEYHIYLFGSDTWRTALNPYFHFTPSEQRPACTKQALYWCCKTEEDKIVVFDIISEVFCMKPFPVCCMEQDLYTPPTLVAQNNNNEDSLCCSYAHRAELSIDVWVLEDYANWSWNRRYVVDVNWCKAENYHSEALRAFANRAMRCVKVVSIQKDELVFYYQGDDGDDYLYSFHLESGFSARTLLRRTDWKPKVDGLTEEWYCGFIGL